MSQYEAWNAAWRQRALPQLAAQPWDLIVVGGGISGAGILREAARRGWRCLLLEQRDFAWGTSSRSSKMVHGGLRYVAKGQLGLIRDSVRERQRLLGEVPGLVEPLSFVMPHYRGGFPGPKVFGGLLSLYDALAGKRNHLFYPLQQLRYLAPGIREDGLLGWAGLAGTPTAIIAAMVFFNYSVVVRTVGGLWARLDSRQAEAAAALGASPMRVLITVTLPALGPAIASAATMPWASAMPA